jgi:hypothetical protein
MSTLKNSMRLRISILMKRIRPLKKNTLTSSPQQYSHKTFSNSINVVHNVSLLEASQLASLASMDYKG